MNARLMALRWERGFCDAYDALIGLAHYPSREDGVLRIAGILRELRLINAEMGVADVKEYSEPVVPPPIPAARNEASMKAFKLEAMEQVTRWAEASRAHVEARHDEAIQRTSLLVQKLVEEANALSESVFN